MTPHIYNSIPRKPFYLETAATRAARRSARRWLPILFMLGIALGYAWHFRAAQPDPVSIEIVTLEGELEKLTELAKDLDEPGIAGILLVLHGVMLEDRVDDLVMICLEYAKMRKAEHEKLKRENTL